jgi:ribosomal protein L6P/L9E
VFGDCESGKKTMSENTHVEVSSDENKHTLVGTKGTVVMNIHGHHLVSALLDLQALQVSRATHPPPQLHEP